MAHPLTLIILLKLLRKGLNFDSRIELLILPFLLDFQKRFLNFSPAHNLHFRIQKSVIHSNLDGLGEHLMLFKVRLLIDHRLCLQILRQVQLFHHMRFVVWRIIWNGNFVNQEILHILIYWARYDLMISWLFLVCLSGNYLICDTFKFFANWKKTTEIKQGRIAMTYTTLKSASFCESLLLLLFMLKFSPWSLRSFFFMLSLGLILRILPSTLLLPPFSYWFSGLAEDEAPPPSGWLKLAYFLRYS